MRFAALATDYDGTLAHEGIVSPAAIETLRRFRASGRRVILLTGRTFASLLEVFPCPEEFDIVVAENGATLYDPATKSEKALTDPPPPRFVAALEERGVSPLDVGRVIVATCDVHKQNVLDVIEELGLELHIVFNKGALMVLPGGINKVTGLQAALNELHLSRHNVAGIGDAENDHAFLSTCEFSAAVENALPTIKERVQFVAHHADSKGVMEVCEHLLSNDLKDQKAWLGQPILIGRGEAKEDIAVDACGVTVLAGPSGGGKSTLTTAFLEGMLNARYQFCAVDPEGDYELFDRTLVLGKPHHVPAVSEVVAALQQPKQSVIVNLLGLDLEERPVFFRRLCDRLEDLRAKTGRPHCTIVDEAHHVLTSNDLPEQPCVSKEHGGLMLITVKPERLPRSLLKSVQLVIAAGDGPQKTLRDYCERAGIEAPARITLPHAPGQYVGWRPGSPTTFLFTPVEVQATRIRHRRKYAEGELAPDRSFYFRGPNGSSTCELST